MQRFILIALLISFGASSVGAEDPRKIKPLMVWSGIDSKQPKDLFARCCSQDEWNAIWNRHLGQDKDKKLNVAGTQLNPCPEIDFASCMVVAIFQGSSRLDIAEQLEEKGCLRLRYKPWGNQILFVPSSDGKEVKIMELGRGEIDSKKPRLLSFAFVVLPKSSKAVVVEEDVQSIIGNAPVWKARAEFPANEKK